MMMSPASSIPPSCSTVFSVISPAGNITQMARGFSASAFTISVSDPAAVAPFFANSSRGLALVSNTTQRCPAFIKRREMLPPMRPSPMMPICILHYSLKQVLVERCIDCVRQFLKAGIDMLKVYAQHATVAFHQHCEVAASLRCLDQSKAVGMSGHIYISRVIAGDLQKHTGVRAAFVGLPGRMLEARSETEAGGGTGLVADAGAHRGQGSRVRRIALDIGEQRHIVARLFARVHAAKMALQIAAKRVVAAEFGRVARIGVQSHAILAKNRHLFG